MEYGLIGEKLSHSFSKRIHERIDKHEYELKEIDPRDLEAFMKEAPFKGINVTIPYKEAVIPFLDQVSDQAKAIGAVNTIVNRNGCLYGYNTDYSGMKSLIEKAGLVISGKKVLILGTGGTSKTAAALCRDLKASSVLKVSRTGKDGALTYQEACADHRDADIIINTTPCGMYPHAGDCPVDLACFPDLKGVIDAIYNPLRSSLVLQALEKGITARGGLYMLVAQAVFAAELFHGRTYGKDLIDDIYTDIVNEKDNICLIGMPRSGKTTVGRLLAQKMNKRFVDSDQVIVEREGMEIDQIFQTKGEAHFRKIESEVIRDLSAKNNLVIATGGGAVLDPQNIKALKGNGILFFLDRPLDQLIPDETSGSPPLPDVVRPLADSEEKIIRLFETRYPIYRAACDQRIINARSAGQAADRILDFMEGRMQILVINGPNLNMLGIREPHIYGYTSCRLLCRKIENYVAGRKVRVDFFQSNHEGALVDRIQEAYGCADGIVINPGAYTHTSVAILDALKAVEIPAVEVHISQVDSREAFRQTSYIRNACIATISGQGTDGYLKAIDLLVDFLQRSRPENRASD